MGTNTIEDVPRELFEWITSLGDFQKLSYHLTGLFVRLQCCGNPNINHYTWAPTP